MDVTYLDYNATAPVRPEVVEAMQACLQKPYNPSSIHTLGREAKRILEDARRVIAEEVSCFPQEVIFTASGSEANNLALRNAGERPLLVGSTEHLSVKVTAERLGGDILPVDGRGLIDLDILEAKLKALRQPAFVSVMLANNETGVIQPLAQIAEIVHRYDGLLHCDAVQALTKITVDMGVLGADMLTISAHKLGGPIGVAALIVRDGVPLQPYTYGGSQEFSRRAGTENLMAIQGFAIALQASRAWTQPLDAMMRAMENELLSAVPEVIIAGSEAQRLPTTSCLIAPGITSETQLMHLDLSGICVGAGSACSSGRIAVSHVLGHMGYSQQVAGSAIRISAGWNTTESELQHFTSCWIEMAKRLLSKAA